MQEGLLTSLNNSPFSTIWIKKDFNPVPQKNLNSMHPHLSRQITQDDFAISYIYSKQSIRKCFCYRANCCIVVVSLIHLMYYHHNKYIIFRQLFLLFFHYNTYLFRNTRYFFRPKRHNTNTGARNTWVLFKNICYFIFVFTNQLILELVCIWVPIYR